MFTIKCFSDASNDRYSNNDLSSFTMDLEHPIEFDSEWEVAVSAVYLNKILGMNQKLKIESRDEIVISDKNRYYKPKKFSELIEELLLLSSHPEIYQPGYFSNFIDKGNFLSTKNLDLYVEKDLIPKTTQSKIFFDLDLEEILPQNSPISDYVPLIFTANDREKLTKSLKKIALSLRQNITYTLQQVLTIFLYQFITSISSKSESYTKHLARFEPYMKDFDSALDHAKEARVSWDKNHDLAHLLIAYFIDQVQIARKKIMQHEHQPSLLLATKAASSKDDSEEEEILKKARGFGAITDFTQAVSSPSFSKRRKRSHRNPNTAASSIPSPANTALNVTPSTQPLSSSSPAAVPIDHHHHIYTGRPILPQIAVDIIPPKSPTPQEVNLESTNAKARVAEALKAQKKRIIDVYDKSRFICIYSDIIREQFVGSKSARLIFLTTLKDSMENSNLFYNRVEQLNWCRVEKKVIQSLSFRICNEFGENVMMNSDYQNILIEISFRKLSSS